MVRLLIRFGLVLCLLQSVTQGVAETLSGDARLTAGYSGPTDRYPHNVLGRIKGWGVLDVDMAACAGCAAVRVSLRLPERRVFEDIWPRLWDVTGDGRPEVVVVQSDQARGARLVVYGAGIEQGRPALFQIAATRFLGTRFRWLAPVGVADLDGDGRIELAYVETPHRDKVLRIIRIADGKATAVASLPGVTAHRIGQEGIEAAIRTCGGQAEIVLLSADYRRVVGVSLIDGALQPRDLGPAADARLPDSAARC